MTSPGYVTIPLPQDGEDNSSSADWRFGRSRDRSHLSPVRVSRTLYSLVRRVLKTYTQPWTILPFSMEAGRSPVTGIAHGDVTFSADFEMFIMLTP